MTKQKKGMIGLIYLLLSVLFLSFFQPIPVFAGAKDDYEESASGGGGKEYLPFHMSIGSEDDPGIHMEYNDDSKAEPTTQGAAWTEVFVKYRVFILGVTGMATLTLLIIWIYLFVRLAGTSGNPMARRQVSSSLLLCGVATALMGSVTFFVHLFLFVLR